MLPLVAIATSLLPDLIKLLVEDREGGIAGTDVRSQATVCICSGHFVE
jgi:hypothetical protein